MDRRWLAGVAALALLDPGPTAWAQNAGANGALANKNPVAVSAGEATADNGSNLIVGNTNRAAAANQGGAAVAGAGLAIGASNSTVSGDKVTAVFGQGNVVAAPRLEQIIPSWTAGANGGVIVNQIQSNEQTQDVDQTSSNEQAAEAKASVDQVQIVEPTNVNQQQDAAAIAAGEGDATATQNSDQQNNSAQTGNAAAGVEQDQTLEQTNTNAQKSDQTFDGTVNVHVDGDNGPGGKIDTGSIFDQHIGELKGANFLAGNTGIVNQSAPTAIAAEGSFNRSGALAAQDAGPEPTNGSGGVGANQKSAALSAGDGVAGDGSNAIIGNGNTAAAANQGGASVGGDGTALGFSDNKVEGDDSTVVFGADNVVATVHLSQVIGQTGVNGGQYVGGISGGGDLITGDINSVSVSSATGANRIQLNTGVGNQAAPLAIAAKLSFN